MALVSGQSGYLSGVWAAETGCGTVDAPWHVRVQPGQRINVTLFDFAVPSSTNNNRTSSADVHSATVSSAAGIQAHVTLHLSVLIPRATLTFVHLRFYSASE